MNILLTDDDRVSRRILERLLERNGFAVSSYDNGEDAFAAFSQGNHDVIISDWVMPGLDGLELCRKVRGLDLPNYTYFILQTASAGPEKRSHAAEQGVDDFLVKPVRTEELLIRLAVAQRILEQRREIREKMRILAQFPSANPYPVFQVSGDGRILYANNACRPLLDAWGREVGDMAPPQLIATPEDAAIGFDLPQPGAGQEMEMECAGRIFALTKTPIEQGIVYYYGHDITERKRVEQESLRLKNQAVHLSLHDQLTGLPNRVLMEDRLRQSLVRARRGDGRLALIMLDVDNFKDINDVNGHKFGDQVIALVGQTVQDNIRETDTVCRWGGDEFMVLLTGIKNHDDAASICAKLVSAVQERAHAAELGLRVTISLGYAVFPDDADCETSLMQHADAALYEAKSAGRNCWRDYRAATGVHQGVGQSRLFQRLAEAVRQHSLEAHFQPLVNARTRQIVGFEALARWNDPELGWVGPDRFIPLAEAKGLIVEVGRWIARLSLGELAVWRGAGHKMSVSLNVSKRQLLDPGFAPEILDLAREHRIDPSWVVLEATERQSLLNNPRCRESLEHLASQGFRLSLDDFGSGHSSFDMVEELPFHELKISTGLCAKARNPKGRRILRAIVEMCQTLGLETVVEGVEDEAMARNLREIGADKLQGYHFSQPLPADAVLSYLNRPAQARAA